MPLSPLAAAAEEPFDSPPPIRDMWLTALGGRYLYRICLFHR